MKRCGKCLEEKPLDFFSKNKSRPDGLSWNCKACVSAYKADYYSKNRDALVKKQRDLKAANPAAIRGTNARATAKYYRANKQKRLAYAREWHAHNQPRCAANQKIWRRANPHQVAAWKAGRRCAERRPCGWIDQDVVNSMYALARAYREAGVPCHVDHVVPLQSRLVCGLHTHNNLSLVGPKENSSKGNRRWPDMP